MITANGFVVTVRLYGDDIPKVYDTVHSVENVNGFVIVNYGRNTARFFSSNVVSITLTPKDINIELDRIHRNAEELTKTFLKGGDYNE